MRAFSSASLGASPLAVLELVAVPVGGMKEAAHIDPEVVVLELAVVVRVEARAGLLLVGSAAWLLHFRRPPFLLQGSKREADNGGEVEYEVDGTTSLLLFLSATSLLVFLSVSSLLLRTTRSGHFPRVAREVGEAAVASGARRERAYRRSGKTLGIQISCSHLEYRDAFADPRCSSSTGIYAVPWPFHVRGATSLRLA